MKHRKTRLDRAAQRGFTLIEVIVVIIIIGVLATLIAPRLLSRVGHAKQSTAANNAASLSNAMRLFWADCGAPPPGASMMILIERPTEADAAAWKGPYLDNRENLLDPWGKPFLLLVPGKKNVDFDIVSYGADGQPGGDGENADIVKP